MECVYYGNIMLSYISYKGNTLTNMTFTFKISLVAGLDFIKEN